MLISTIKHTNSEEKTLNQEAVEDYLSNSFNWLDYDKTGYIE